MSEPLFYRSILTGFFLEQREKSDIKISDILHILCSFSGVQPQKRLYSRILYGMENQAIFGYGIKVHAYRIYNEQHQILNEKRSFIESSSNWSDNYDSFIEHIGQRVILKGFPEIAAYQCSEFDDGEVPDSLWAALGYMLKTSITP